MGNLLRYCFDGSDMSDTEYEQTYDFIDKQSWNGCFDVPPFPTRRFYAYLQRPIESYYPLLPPGLKVLHRSGNIS